MRKPKQPTEAQIQISILAWAGHVKYKDGKLADYLHHSPNGGFRNVREATKFKRMGVKAGYPDLILDIAKNGYHGLRVELKRTKGGRLTDNQKERLQMLNDEGYLAVACAGFDEAVKTIKEYMEGE